MAESNEGQVTFGWSGNEGADTASASGRRTPGRRRSPAPERLPPPTNVSENPLPADNELWDVRAAARFLKRSVSWVYHKAEDGTLPVRRLGGWGVRFIPAELRAWVDSGGGGRPGR